jgi:hypothetical protein
MFKTLFLTTCLAISYPALAQSTDEPLSDESSWYKNIGIGVDIKLKQTLDTAAILYYSKVFLSIAPLNEKRKEARLGVEFWEGKLGLWKVEGIAIDSKARGIIPQVSDRGLQLTAVGNFAGQVLISGLIGKRKEGNAEGDLRGYSCQWDLDLHNFERSIPKGSWFLTPQEI